MLFVANLLFLLSAIPTFLLVSSSKGPGPEGPVGAHMITIPLALLQIAALAVAFHRGDWQFVPVPAFLFYAAMLGYLAAMTMLPILAVSGGDRLRWRWVVLGVLAGGMAAINGSTLAGQTRAVQVAGGLVVALVGLAGWLMLGALFVHNQRNAIRAAAANEERMDAFQKGQAEFQLGEFGKLPADAALWQLIQFTHSFHPDVKAQCRARIAALPDLQGAMIELLGTGWAKHALAYLDDGYPLPHAPLAGAFAKFLDEEFAHWQPTLTNHANAGSWSANLYHHFEVADKILRGGGDVRKQVQRWQEFLARTRGMGGLAARLRQILGPR